MSPADRLYGWLLRALPGDLREDAADMGQLFRDQRRSLRGQPVQLAGLWIAAVSDVASTSFAERRASRRPFSWRSLMRGILSDLRHGARLARRHPGPSLLSALLLALGIGVNVAIFSVVDAVLLQALPYSDPDRLAMVWESRPRENVLDNVVSPADFLDWRRQNTAFERMAGFSETTVTITGTGEPQRVGAGVVSPAFFDVLGVRMAEGRTFRGEEEILGRHRVLVLTHGYWQRAFGGDRSAIGRRIQMNGNAWEIIGVLPRSFRFSTSEIELWAPLVLETPGQPPPTRVSHQLLVYARLKPDVPLAEARSRMDALGKQLEEKYPQENSGHSAWVTSLREEFVGPVRANLLVLFGGVGFVLLIACVNVANLRLAHAAARRREMTVRAALGAGRARLVRQGLAESLVIAALGVGLGLVVGALVLRALPAVMPEQLSVVGLGDVGLTSRVWLFACALGVITTALVGLVPALQASRPRLTDALQDGRGAGGIRKRARLALVLGEVALATLLLAGAGLALRSFLALVHQPLGFDPAGRLTVTISPAPGRYPNDEVRRQALDDFERRFAALPGVISVGAINFLPLGGGNSRSGVAIEGREPTPDAPTRLHPRSVTPTLFQTLGLRVVRGRAFTNDDGPTAEPVALLSETAVRRFWPDSDPIGQRVRMGGTEIWRRVIGIVGDIRHAGLAQPSQPELYLPQAQFPWGSLSYVLRTDLPRASIAASIRATIVEADPNLPVGAIRTLDEVIAVSVRSERALTILMGVFGGVALLLAVVGIYGVMSQLVGSRRQEIGIRMSLGARPATILRLLLTEASVQTGIGLVIGLAAGVWLMRLAGVLLAGVKPWDPLALAGVSLVLVAAALAACYVPARRAMKVDPVEALRG